MNNAEKAIGILQATEDGDQLHPFDLKLLEMAVNGLLNDAWQVKFEELHADVMGGRYESPFEAAFHGIPQLRIDPEGYVSWRGVKVEHYSMPWAWSEEGKAKAHKLAARCLRYEDAGLEVTWAMIWQTDRTVGEEREGLRVGDYIWYWLKDGESHWVRAILQGFTHRSGALAVDVYLPGDVYPTRWGYLWQTATWSEETPARPANLTPASAKGEA